VKLIKQGQSQIEAIQSLMKVEGTQYNVILYEMRVLCKNNLREVEMVLEGSDTTNSP